VSALCDPVLAAQVRNALIQSTGSFGVRGRVLDRWPEARDIDHVDVSGYPIRIKVGAGRAKVEHDDAARVARRIGVPLHEVVSLAEEAWRQRSTVTRLASTDGAGEPRGSGGDASVEQLNANANTDLAPDPDEAG
jgi:uncharacterized protein (DUF111 family)